MIKKPLTTLLQRCLLVGWGLCALQVHAADWYIDNQQELIKDDTVGQTFDPVRGKPRPSGRGGCQLKAYEGG